MNHLNDDSYLPSRGDLPLFKKSDQTKKASSKNPAPAAGEADLQKRLKIISSGLIVSSLPPRHNGVAGFST